MSDCDASIVKNKNHLINLTRKYIYLSNQANFNEISHMINKDAILYDNEGIDSIIQGLHKFSEIYHNPFWIIHEYNLIVNELAVEIVFDRYWTDLNTMKINVVSASEIIRYNEDDMIINIRYSKRPDMLIKREVDSYPS